MDARSPEQLDVLIIDDDPDARRLLVEIVTRREHNAVPAESAEEGLNLLPYWTFQLAFLDQNLPGMEGLVLGEYFRRHNPHMTIALVTGEEDVRLERRTKDLSLLFIPKPFQVRDIVKVIDATVEAAQERAQARQRQEDPDFEPPISRYVDDLGGAYGVPNVPGRIEERLVETIKRCLSNLRTVSRYSERDRVIALSGLLTAKVLDVSLPRSTSGLTLFEEYDRVMREHGRRTEFDD